MFDFWQNNILWIAKMNIKMYLAMCDDKTTNTVGPNSTTMAFNHRVGNIVQIANKVLSQKVWILHLNAGPAAGTLKNNLSQNFGG